MSRTYYAPVRGTNSGDSYKRSSGNTLGPCRWTVALGGIGPDTMGDVGCAIDLLEDPAGVGPRRARGRGVRWL